MRIRTALLLAVLLLLPPPASAATLALSFNGRLRDRVGQGDTALGADGALDGTFTVSVSGLAGAPLPAQAE